jgi:hypothetical protein
MSVLSHRLFYACEAIGFAADGTNDFIKGSGIQSAGINVDFNLQYISELGKLPSYDVIEQINEVEITFEQVLGGDPLVYHLLTQGATDPSLIGRSAVKATMALNTYPDTVTASSGAPLMQAIASGLYFSSVGITATVDGNVTHNVTGVGNNLIWTDLTSSGAAVFSGNFLANAVAPSGVKQRRNIVFTPASTSPAPALDANGMTNQFMTVIPTNIYGISSSGVNPLNSEGNLTVPIQSITISADSGRTDILALGSFLPWAKFLNVPVTVRTEISVNTNIGMAASTNTSVARNYQTIRLRIDDGTQVDCGQLNKLASVSTSGGDTGGGPLQTRFTYSNQNQLQITSPTDPAGLMPPLGSGY